MAFRYLIYSTGTTFASTIVRESATNNPGANEASYYTNFVIPEIQPLYLWRVDNVTTPTNVLPNSDANINAYLAATAPAPQPEDDASVGFVTGITSQKIDIVTGATGNLGTFNASGNLDDSGYSIAQLTGGTSYIFVGSGGTQVFESGSNPTTVTIFSTVPTGTTVAWGGITGNISSQTDLWGNLTWLSGETATKLAISTFSGYTGTTQQTITGIENDIIYLSGVTDTKLDISTFSGYTGSTQPILDAALTGVTNLGTGSTLGSTSGRNVTIKSISVLGGLSLSGDGDNLIISGQTGSTGGGTWGTITGDISNQTDLWGNLTWLSGETATKLSIAVFSGYTGTTDLRLQGIENDITYLSGVTDTKLDISAFTGYSATTKIEIDSKLSIATFSGYTGTTQPILDAALTGATNGLVTNGRDVELGGSLTRDTSITGLAYGFTANTKNILLQAINGINIIDTDGVGGVNIESDAGTVAIIGNTSGSAERTKLEISETQMLITDSRTGATKVGMQYAADYSATFTPESLITKRYADAIAAGLTVKASVLVATTGNTVLSGLTIIDGVQLSNGDRVLVKNQVSGETNGIYIASAGAWTRATDFDGNPSGEVVSGDLVPVISGNTQYNTLWALITPNPITIGVDPLIFTLFSSPHELIAGHGIAILANTISVDGGSLAGNSISWSGTTGNETYNVDVNSGTLQTALAGKQATITGAATTITTANLTINRVLVSDGSGKVAVSTITSTELGYLSGTTANIQTQLNNKLATSVFNTFTGTTLPANYYNKSEINTYTGATEQTLTGLSASIATKLDTAVFSAYTGTTAPNEIFLIHTGGTELNTILASAIIWDAEGVTGATGAAFSWTGSSEIQVLETGLYELNYNIPYNINSNSQIGVGANVILNNATVIDVTAAAGLATRVAGAASVGLPTVILSLTANDVLNLATFRTHQSGSATSSLTGSILIKKKNTLQ